MANEEPRSVRVRRMILDIEDALKTETPAQVSSRFAEYQKEFPKIFELLLSRNYTRDILAMMIDQLERMERGSVSQHNASVAVGTILVDRIVKPQLKPADAKN
jgi:IS4 transposase